MDTSTSDPAETNNPWWMGGTSADGIPTQQTAAAPPPRAPVLLSPPPQPRQDGAITRFATPDMAQQYSVSYTNAAQQPTTIAPVALSYAARSQAAYQQLPQGYQQQQHPQLQHQQPGYAARLTPATSAAASTAGGSYAARSQAAYQQQPPLPQNVYTTPNATAPIYATQPQPYMQQQQQQHQPNHYNTPTTIATPSPHAPHAQDSAYNHQLPLPPDIPVGPTAPSFLAAHEQLEQRLLTDATRKLQEHSYYMKQAMEQNNLAVVLDRAAHMLGELGGPPPHASGADACVNTGLSAKLSPKLYYELYMRALEDMPVLKDYLLQTVSDSAAAEGQQAPIQQPTNVITIVDTSAQHYQPTRTMTLRELYDCVQYCPRVVSRLYLQILVGSAMTDGKWVLNDVAQAIRCEQNPIRGLFLRHFMLTTFKDKLPDKPAVENDDDNDEEGTVQDSYQFVLDNLFEMNKLWVRIQHLPGEGKLKEVLKRRSRERNDLRLLVGTNLVRLSQLECVTSKMYGEMILPQILEHIVVVGDPLSQAYLMDCLVQVFPDEYHIETLPILLHVCPRLRDKVNIRTILQGLMDRLANYLMEEELLDESDTNQVKKTLARDSFGLFEECVQNVYNARGPKLTSKEVIRLQTALLRFSIKCYPGHMHQVARCIGGCVQALKQANVSYDIIPDGTMASIPEPQGVFLKQMDDVAVSELETLLSIPLDTLGMRVLELEHYSSLISFLPWSNRRDVAITMLKAIDSLGSAPKSVSDITELFTVIRPVIQDEPSTLPDQPLVLYVDRNPEKMRRIQEENTVVSKLIHLLDHEHTDVLFEMLAMARNEITLGGPSRSGQTLIALVFASVKLADRLFRLEEGIVSEDTSKAVKTIEMVTDELADAVSSNETIVYESADATVVPTMEKVTDKLADADPSNETVVNESPADVTNSATKTSTVDIVSDDTRTAAPTNEVATDETADAAPSKETVVNESAVATQDANESNASVMEEQGTDTILSTCNAHNAGDGDAAANEAGVADNTPEIRNTYPPGFITCRRVFVFIHETIAMIAKISPETGVKLFLELSLAADDLVVTCTETDGGGSAYTQVAFELLSQAYTVYEEDVTDSKTQPKCIQLMIGTLSVFKSLGKQEYESFVTKTAQFSAKVLKKTDQCELVALCSHLFYPTSGQSEQNRNAQRALECLQRALKLADACTSANPSDVQLFVDLLEIYVHFFEEKNPAIAHAYISGLVDLVKEHISTQNNSLGGDSRAVVDAKAHFVEIVKSIRRKKKDEATAALFAPVLLDNVGF
jgi:vacuolar protein sorting-associated protein 35